MLRRYGLLAVLLSTIAFGLWLRRPALSFGFHGDDSAQLAMLSGDFPAPRAFFDLFRFADVERDGHALMDFGYQPWWTQPNLRIAMFRPLSSSLMALDYWLFGTDAVPFHLHSLFWWTTAVAAAALVFRTTLPPLAACLAAGFYAVHVSTASPSIWWANRSTLVCATFGFIGVWLHVHCFDNPSRRGRLLEGVCFSLSLLGGEYGITAAVYVAAFEMLRLGEPYGERVRAAAPMWIPLGGYLLLRWALDYGIRGSGFYISPTAHPLQFIEEALSRVPTMLSDLTLGIPAQWFVLGSPWTQDHEAWQRWQPLLGVGGTLVVCWLAWRLSRSLDDAEQHNVRFLMLGSLLGVPPVVGALPEDRLLVAPALGVCAVFALVIHRTVESFRAGAMPIPVRGAGLLLSAALLYRHAYQAAERTGRQLLSFANTAEVQRQWSLSAQLPDDPNVRGFMLCAADFSTNVHLPFIRLLAGHPLPKSFWRLTGNTHVQEIHRTEKNVIEVASLSNALAHTMVGSLHRAMTSPMPPGYTVKLDGLTAEVIASEGPHPWRTRYTFAHDLSDPASVFLHSTAQGMTRFRLPPVGQKLRMPHPVPPRFLHRPEWW